MLDVGVGTYWFFPSWTMYPPQIDYAAIPLVPGTTPFEIIPQFAWPAGVGGSGGLSFFFYGAVLTIDLATLMTDLASWHFSYEE